MDAVTLGMAKAAARKEALGLYRGYGRQTVVLLGDSIVSQNASQYNTTGATIRAYNGQGWFTHAQIRLGHRFSLLRNSGISGEKVAQMLARLSSDVLTVAPGWCVIGGPTNDVSAIGNATLTAAASQASLISIWDQLDAANIRIVQCVVAPRNVATSAVRNALLQYNQWLRMQARTRRRMILVDWYSELSSGTLVDYRSGHVSAGDASGLHPQPQGAAEMGRIFAARMLSETQPVSVVPVGSNEAENLVGTAALAIGTGGVVGTGGAGAVAAGWQVQPLPTASFTCSKVARTDGQAGEWQQVVVASGMVKIGVNVTGYGTVYTAGDEVYAVAEFETNSDLTAGPGNSNNVCLNLIAMKADFGVGTQAYDHNLSASDAFPAASYFPRAGVFMTPLTVVPTTATLRLALQFEVRGAGTVRVGRIGMYKVGTGPGADVWARSDANVS